MRRTPSPSSRRRVPRWTWYERLLCVMSALLLASTVGVEVYRWTNPPPAPAAPRLQDETATASETPTLASDPPTTATEAAPTATGASSATPVPPTETTIPTPFSNDQPLMLQKSASVARAVPGERFGYTLLLTSNSLESRTAQVRDYFDERLEVVSATATSGSCQGSAEVICSVPVQRGTPATIQIIVRVRPAATIGSMAVSQALAQDDLNNTVASDPVQVMVVAPAPTPTSTPTTVPTATVAPQVVAAPSAPTRTPVAPTERAPAETASTERPNAPVPSATFAPTDESQVVAAPDTNMPTPTPQPAEAAPTQALLAAAQPTSVPTSASQPAAPTAAAAQPTIAGSNAAPLLPDTAISTPLLGVAVALFGIALACQSARRLRTADAQVAAQGVSLGRLASLAQAAVRRQRTAAQQLGQLCEQSDALTTLLSHAEPRSGIARNETEAK